MNIPPFLGAIQDQTEILLFNLREGQLHLLQSPVFHINHVWVYTFLPKNPVGWGCGSVGRMLTTHA